MSLPNLLPGNRWRLGRGNGDGPPETFNYVCTATTLDLDEKVDLDDNMMADCDTPNALPQRVSTPKGYTWDITASGKCDAARYAKLRADFTGVVLRDWQLLIDLPNVQGGGAHVGAAYISNLKQTKSDNGTVTFNFSLKGQGQLVWTPAAT